MIKTNLTENSQKIACVDFDGTLIRSNSFPKWVLFSLKGSLKEGRLILFLQIFILLSLRKVIPLLSHVEFKKRINSLNYPKGWADAFCEKLYQENISLAVLTQIKKLGVEKVIVTTAAPCCYAKSLPVRFAFEKVNFDVLCSHLQDQCFYDNYRENKKELTLAHIGNNEFVLFTDHRDDIAIAKCAKDVFLCNPTHHNREIFDAENIQYDLIQD